MDTTSLCLGLGRLGSSPICPHPSDIGNRVKKRLKLKSKYRRRVEVATEYAKMIDDFNDMVDQRTLACHCLGPEPAPYVLHAIEIEEKNKCPLCSSLTLIFLLLSFFFFFSSAEMYAKMRAKKNVPLSNLRKGTPKSLRLLSSLKRRGPLPRPPWWKRSPHARKSSAWLTREKKRPTLACPTFGTTLALR
ncbi:hypothetical protein SO802_016931 [Lithocarpus litseifolius]|uniref:Uncharacterized protein n=1 Tax=Lithocarpus litseifolius TaxID=425828 RepID=A0AAW2CXY3_9ROSI